MTAESFKFDSDFLDECTSKNSNYEIINKLSGINRVCYDLKLPNLMEQIYSGIRNFMKKNKFNQYLLLKNLNIFDYLFFFSKIFEEINARRK